MSNILQLSNFGRKLTEKSGIVDLMNDLGEAVALRPDMLMLGGGNPAAIPEMQALWRESAGAFLSNQPAFDKSLASYDSPQGDPFFLDAVASMFRDRFHLPIASENVAVVSGAQLGMFCLLNLLAGEAPGGRKRKVLIPASPEYVGYADMGVEPDLFVACPAKITYPDPNDLSTFKYVVDFEALEDLVQTEDVAAVLVSRPTNPSGNVLTRDELAKLERLAERIDAWLIIDNAYGGPFPGIIEDEKELDSVFWGKRTILTYSLSKIGLPGLRTGFIIAPSEIVERITSLTAIVGLANGSLGQRIAQPFFETGKILDVSRTIVRPYYQRRRRRAVERLKDEFKKAGIDARIHKSEGSFFLLAWFPELQSGSRTLYRLLKERGVLVIPCDEFFYGLPIAERSTRNFIFEASRTQMLRISFSAPEETVEKGFQMIAQITSELLALEKSNY